MTNDAEAYMQKIKARNFVQNNGQILRTINILHVNYENCPMLSTQSGMFRSMTFCHRLITSFVGIHFAPSYQNKRTCRHRRCSV